MEKDLIVDWIGTFVNFSIILFLFIKSLWIGILDILDISLTLFGLIISVFIIVIKIINTSFR